MTRHVTRAVVGQFTAGKLPPEATLSVARHLEECTRCRSVAAETLYWEAAAETWRGALHAALDDHLRGSTLFDYADGTLTADEVPEADAHLEHCRSCRDDVADLRSLRTRRSRKMRIALPAAAALILVAGLAVLARRTPVPAPAPIARPSATSATRLSPAAPNVPASWSDLVAAAVAAGRIDPPAILETLRMPADDALRGGRARPFSAVTPDGVVIENPRPAFRWDASLSAVCIVSVFTGDREVMRSASLHRNVWTPDRDLERGRTYRWQVEARSGSTTWIVPSTPQPAAIFRLLDETAQRDLDTARRRSPGDHLLLGVLAAHYGLREEAIAQMTLYQSSHPDPAATALLASVRDWRQRAQR
jgi:anti-sigma factor RsiW